MSARFKFHTKKRTCIKYQVDVTGMMVKTLSFGKVKPLSWYMACKRWINDCRSKKLFKNDNFQKI